MGTEGTKTTETTGTAPALPHPVLRLVDVLGRSAAFYEADVTAAHVARAERIVEEHCPVPDAWSDVVALRARFGRRAATCYLIGAGVPARHVADVVAALALAMGVDPPTD